MNQEINQLASITTSLKIAENDQKKLKEQLDVLESNQKVLDEQYNVFDQEYKKVEKDFKEYKENLSKESDQIKEEIGEIKLQLKDRQEDIDLYFEIKNLQKDIERLKNSNEFLTKEIEDIKQDKFTPGYRKHLHKMPSNEEREKLLKQLSSNMLVQKYKGYLTLASIKSIFDTTMLYFAKDFVKKTYEDRIERRKVLDNDTEYVKLVLAQSETFDSAVDSAQLEILNRVGFSLDEFSQNIEFHFTNGNQDIYIMTTQVPQKLKLFIPSRKTLNLEQVKEILTYEKEILNKELEIFKILEKEKSEITPDAASNLISNRLFDRIYEKFNIEEEDLTKSIQSASINSDVEVLGLFKDIREQILEKLPKPPMMSEEFQQ